MQTRKNPLTRTGFKQIVNEEIQVRRNSVCNKVIADACMRFETSAFLAAIEDFLIIHLSLLPKAS